MTYKEAVSLICELEGKKVQVSIGNVKEVLKALKVLCKSDKVFVDWLVSYLQRK